MGTITNFNISKIYYMRGCRMPIPPKPHHRGENAGALKMSCPGSLEYNNFSGRVLIC